MSQERAGHEELQARVHARLAAGDLEGGTTEAIRELGPQVLRYLRSILREEAAASDAFSAWAEDLWRGLPGFRGDASLRGWALRLAYHAALAVRHQAWRRRGRPLLTGEASRIAEEVRTKTVVRVERQRQALERLRESLSDEDRTLLALRVDQGLPWAEVAEVLAGAGGAVEPATLMKRFERLKARLAQLARDEGLVE